MKCSRATERRAIAFLKMVMDVLTSVYIRFHRESPHQRCSYTKYRYCSQDINVFSVFCRAPSVFSKHLVIPLLKPLFHHCEVVCSSSCIDHIQSCFKKLDKSTVSYRAQWQTHIFMYNSITQLLSTPSSLITVSTTHCMKDIELT